MFCGVINWLGKGVKAVKYQLPIMLLMLSEATTAHAIDAQLYGHVNRGMFVFNDGKATDVVFTDNYMASSRLGVQGKEALDNGLTAGFVFEAELLGNASNQFVQQAGGVSGTTPLNGSEILTSRLALVNLQGRYGNLALGKLSTAIDGALTQDLVGAKDVMSAEFRKIGGALKFQKADGSGLSTLTVGSLTEAQSTNRSNAIRYDTPIVNGLQGKASVAQGGDLDLAMFYNGDKGDWKFKGAAGVYFNNDEAVGTNVTDIRYLASASISHVSGIAGTFGYSTNHLENKTAAAIEAQNWYAKVGYTTGPFELAADLGQAKHFQSAILADNQLSTYGLAAQYALFDGVSLGTLYRNVSADVTGVSTQDIDLYGMTMKVKF
jgi:hypothetical protein